MAKGQNREKNQKEINIHQNHLAIIEDTLKETRKTYEGLFDSPSFRAFINQTAKMNEFVGRIIGDSQPILDLLKHFDQQYKTQIDFINSVTKSIQMVPMFPLEREVIMAHSPRPRYTEEDVEIIVGKVIDTAMKKMLQTGQNSKMRAGRYPYKLPNDFKWENMIIKFRDGHNVQIVAGEHITTANYKEMGFEDSKQLKPDSQWIFFKGLSTRNGELAWGDKMAKLNIKSKKYLLSKALKEYFGMRENPFYSYRKEKAYRIKIRLVPESQPLPEIPLQDSDDNLGVREFYNELTGN